VDKETYFLPRFVSQLICFILTKVLLHVQSSPDTVRKWQERLRPGGIWEQDQGDTDGGIDGSVDGRCNEHNQRAGATAASEADKARTSTTPATEDEGGDLCMAGQLPMPDPQAADAGGADVEDDMN
jgi:hypothetical protein